MSLSATTASIAVTGTALLSGRPHVVFAALAHWPTVGKHWSYTIRVTGAGRPLAATITAQIVDAIGGVHPFPFGATRKVINGWRFAGTFTNLIAFPADSRGIPLTITVGAAQTLANSQIVPVG